MIAFMISVEKSEEGRGAAPKADLYSQPPQAILYLFAFV